MTETIVLRRLDDLHCHFRNGELSREPLPYTTRYAGRAIAMLNMRPDAVLTEEDVIRYRDEIRRVLGTKPKDSFEPLMTVEIRGSTTPRKVIGAHRTVGTIRKSTGSVNIRKRKSADC